MIQSPNLCYKIPNNHLYRRYQQYCITRPKIFINARSSNHSENMVGDAGFPIKLYPKWWTLFLESSKKKKHRQKFFFFPAPPHISNSISLLASSKKRRILFYIWTKSRPFPSFWCRDFIQLITVNEIVQLAFESPETHKINPSIKLSANRILFINDNM